MIEFKPQIVLYIDLGENNFGVRMPGYGSAKKGFKISGEYLKEWYWIGEREKPANYLNCYFENEGFEVPVRMYFTQMDSYNTEKWDVSLSSTLKGIVVCVVEFPNISLASGEGTDIYLKYGLYNPLVFNRNDFTLMIGGKGYSKVGKASDIIFDSLSPTLEKYRFVKASIFTLFADKFKEAKSIFPLDLRLKSLPV